MSDLLSAVVVAAGKSQRMGFDKLLTPIAGKPLLAHTLQGVFSSPLISELMLVIRSEDQEAFEMVVNTLSPSVPVRYVNGGKERQDSVWNGLQAVSADSTHVMIQDAARPFVNADLIHLVMAEAKRSGAAVCGAPCSDTLKEGKTDGEVIRTLDRSRIWTVQTPQIFSKELICKAYATIRKSERRVTDDTAAVEEAGGKVRMVLYHGINLKITTSEDWALAQLWLLFSEKDSLAGNKIRSCIHDINNQLTALFGYTYLLNLEVQSHPKCIKYLEQIDLAGKHSQELITNLHRLAKQLFPKEEDPISNGR